MDVDKMKETIMESSKPVLDLNEKIRILHVDDDSRFLKATKRCLELDAPILVDTATSVKEALGKLKRKKCDAVISDYQMPEKDGLEFLKELRQKGNSIPFIMFTEKSSEEVVIKALNLGANQYLNKTGETREICSELAHRIEELAITRRAQQKQSELEEKLTESDENYQDILENARDLIYTHDLKGKIISVNKIVQEYGYTQEQIIGKNMLKFIPKRYWPKLIAQLSQVALGKRVEGEIEVNTPRGKITGEYRSNPIIRGNKIVGVRSIMRDISEKKRIEKALFESQQREHARELEESEEKFRRLCDDARMLMVRTDLKGTVTYVNNIVEEYGLRKDDIIGKNMLKFISPKDRLRLLREHIHVIRGNNSLGETVLITPKGKLDIEYRGNPVTEKGKIVGEEVLARDVTERKEMEGKLQEYATELESKVEERTSALRKSEENLQTMLNSVHTGIIVVDPATHSIREANAAATKMFGAPKEKIIGAICHKFICPADFGHCPITDLKQTVDHSERKLLTSSGKTVPVIKTVIVADIGGQTQLVESFIDISDIKVLEDRLEHALDQQTSLMISSAAMIHTPKLQERLHAILSAIQSLGWRRVVLSVRNAQLDIEKPEDLVTVGLTDEEEKSLWNNRRTGKVWQERLGPEFERFKISEFYYVPWEDPFVQEKFGTGIVLSHLKREEMIDWNPDDLLYAPLRLSDGRVVALISMDDPIDGRRPTKESLAPLELFLHQAAVAIENAQLIEQFEAKVEERTRDLIEAQSKLLKAERLAAIGELAGMVGHDLRNPLTSIAGAVYYLKTRCASKMNEKEKDMFATIEKSIDHSNKIISDLLDYSREIKLDRSTADPKSLLEDALVHLQVPMTISIVNETETEPTIKVDKDKIQRVFINLIKNAFDAMPNGGVLTIKSKETQNVVSFSFTDTGTGMSEETLQKLWNPLFTTKSKGMGFGLPICKRLIEAHGGKISVVSDIGKGTTFTIAIPIEQDVEQVENVIVDLPEKIKLTERQK
jgi:PAS domain S-box-containing protein